MKLYNASSQLAATPQTRGDIVVLLLIVLIGILSLALADRSAAQPHPTNQLPQISAQAHHLTPLTLAVADRHQPDPRTPTISQQLPAVVSSGSLIAQQITVSNNELYDRTLTVTQQVPNGFAVDTLPDDVEWDSATRSWTWRGDLAGGNRDYVIVADEQAVPYLDLAAYGVADLCDQFALQVENETTVVNCHNKQVDLNIGQQGQNVLLYGMAWRSLTLHTDGRVTFGDSRSALAEPRIMPSPLQGVTLAPLHADFDLSYTSNPTATTQVGRWHAAVINEWIDGHDALVVQWHNAPLTAFRSTSVRMALVLPLWTDGTQPPDVETAWFVYDNVSHPSRLIEQSYSIGVQDGAGERGVSYAHSIDGDVRGTPPTNGVLRLLPIRYGDAQAAQRTLSLIWRVRADAPADLVSTVAMTSDSQQQPLAHSWDTQQLAVRYQTYLPLIGRR